MSAKICGALMLVWGLAVSQMAGAAPAAEEVPRATALGSGARHAVMEMDPGLPTHTLYHPADLASGDPLPVVLWGNGACANGGDRFRWFLSDIASYGYLVIAIGPIMDKAVWPPQMMVPVGAGATPVIPKGQSPLTAAPATHSSQLLDALHWAVAENERQGSRFYHRLNTKAVAAMGQSCGGAQALEASFDPGIRTTVLWNSGLFPTVTTMAGGAPLTKADLKKLHGPIAYISGDEEDLAYAYANANDDFQKIDHVPVFRAFSHGVVHEGTYSERNGGEFSGIAVAWLNWQLKQDQVAKYLFVGAHCGLCVNPHWVVHTKNMR